MEFHVVKYPFHEKFDSLPPKSLPSMALVEDNPDADLTRRDIDLSGSSEKDNADRSTDGAHSVDRTAPSLWKQIEQVVGPSI